MKYLKKAYKLINSYPVILLCYLPLLIVLAVNMFRGYNTSLTLADSLITMSLSLVTLVVSIIVQLLITKIAFTVRKDNDKDYEISVKDTLRNIPKVLLNILAVAILIVAAALLFFISLVPNILGASLTIIAETTFGMVGAVLFSIGAVVKILMYFISAVFIGIYSIVFLLFINTNLSIFDMMKASMRYTFKNFKKLFKISLLATILPQLVLLGGLFMYNIYYGLSFYSLHFMSTNIYMIIQIIISLLSLIYTVAIILTWNDEKERGSYLLPAKKIVYDPNITR